MIEHIACNYAVAFRDEIDVLLRTSKTVNKVNLFHDIKE